MRSIGKKKREPGAGSRTVRTGRASEHTGPETRRHSPRGQGQGLTSGQQSSTQEVLSWLIRKRHPSRAFISSRCVTLSSTSPQRAASSSSAAPPPRRSALFPALSRSFPSALFPAAFLLHAPRSARRLSCLHSCGGSPKRTRQYARWYRREAYLPWNEGAE